MNSETFLCLNPSNRLVLTSWAKQSPILQKSHYVNTTMTMPEAPSPCAYTDRSGSCTFLSVRVSAFSLKRARYELSLWLVLLCRDRYFAMRFLDSGVYKWCAFNIYAVGTKTNGILLYRRVAHFQGVQSVRARLFKSWLLLPLDSTWTLLDTSRAALQRTR